MKNKEQEFLKLIEYTLIDGYINETERNTLKKKGLQMGMDADEVDVILDAKLHVLSQEKAKELNKCQKCGEILKSEGARCTSCDYKPISKTKNKKNESEDKTAEQAVNDIAEANGILITGKNNNISKYGLLWRLILTICTGGIYLIYFRKKNHSLSCYFDANNVFHFKTLNEIENAKKQVVIKYDNKSEIASILDKITINAKCYKRNRIIADVTRVLALIVIVPILSAYTYKIVSEKKFLSNTNQISATPLDTIDLINKAIINDKPNEAEKWYNLTYKEKSDPELKNKIQGARVDSLIKIKKMDDALEQANLLLNVHDFSHQDRERDNRVDSLLQIKINHYINLNKLDKAEKYTSFINDFELEEKLRKELKTEIVLQKAKTKKH